MNDLEHEARWELGPTKAEAQARVMLASNQQRVERQARVLKAWRARNPQATCSDFVALTLIDLETKVSEAREARAQELPW